MNWIPFSVPLVPLSTWSHRRSRRPATQSSVLGAVMWPWMAWSPTPPTCCRSERAQLPGTEPAARVSSSRPAPTVSPPRDRLFIASLLLLLWNICGRWSWIVRASDFCPGFQKIFGKVVDVCSRAKFNPCSWPLAFCHSAAFSISSESSQVVLIAISSAVAIILLTVLLYVLIGRSVSRTSLCCWLRTAFSKLLQSIFFYSKWERNPFFVSCVGVYV